MKAKDLKRKQKAQSGGSLEPVVGLRPCDCTRIADVLSLERSYREVGIRYGMLIQHDGAVILTDHVPGQPQTGSVEIPRRHFQRLIEWYQTEQPNGEDEP
jgi:hypothetical protein